MEISRKQQRTMTLWVIAGVLLLFFAVTGGLALQLRKHLRDQVISRDGAVFMAVASAEVNRVRELNDGLFEPGADEELIEVALNISEIKGVIGVRVFKPEDAYIGGFPMAMKRGKLAVEDEQQLLQQSPLARFHSDFRLTDIFLMIEEEEEQGNTYPVLEIMIPLFALEDEGVSGFAQYYIDGLGLAAELEDLDSNILTYAGGAFLFGGVLGAVILYWAFRKLRLVNRLLEERTQNLISANHKLSMEARTAAIGAITSHLIHGLKSPLQGIRQFVTARSGSTESDSTAEVWQDAEATTEKMQNLINEVMEVLQDRSEEFSYEISAEEITTLAEERVNAFAVEKNVQLSTKISEKVGGRQLSNDRAHLVVLILVNLLRNAMEATAVGGKVTLRLSPGDADEICFDVEDEAGGLPGEVMNNLFQPVRSSKQDGSGVGLSLCQELARHLDGQLSLLKTGSEGTVFRLTIS